MEEFLDRVHYFAARGFKNSEVLPFLQSNLIAPLSLEPYLFWVPHRYSRNLVFRTQDFELLVICWDRGQASPVHGHEGENCWARVEQGKLQFLNYRETSREGARVTLTATGKPLNGKPGHVDGPADIHGVSNLIESGERAVSLHLYSRPYDECDIFDLEHGTVSKMRLCYDSRHGKVC